MGRSKPLLPLGDRPVIRHCLDHLLESGVAEIIVVLGQNRPEIDLVIGEQPVVRVPNPDPDSDMAGSVRVGLGSVAATATAVLVCLVDHPLVSVETLRTLSDWHDVDSSSILIPAFQGRRGHPTLFPRQVIEELLEVPTLREVVRREPGRIRLIEVKDEGTVLDMDTPEDYALVRERWLRREAGTACDDEWSGEA
jgi:CTP:molybdopterin cytidylyltransferase MocA